MKTTDPKWILAAALAAGFSTATVPAQQVRQWTSPAKLQFGYVDDGDSVTIDVEHGDVKVLLNGKAMPNDRVQRTGTSVRCLDAKGKVVATLHLTGQFGGALTVLPRYRKRLGLGVTLREPSEALSAQLGLDPDECVYVAGVVDDSAADKAGIHKHDVLIELDGKKPATQARLQQILSQKKAGDELGVTLLRRGETHEVKVRLEEARNVGWSFTGPNSWLPLVFSETPVSKQWAVGQMLGRELSGSFPLAGDPVTSLGFTRAKVQPGNKRLVEKLEKLEDRLDRLETLLQRIAEKRSAR